MNWGRSPSLAIALRVAVPVMVLIAVWQLAGGAEVLDRLRALDWRWLVAALSALMLQTVLSAVRWQIVAGALGVSLSSERAMGEYFVAQLVNQTVPGGVVGDAARAVRSRHAAGLARSAQAVIIERLAGQIVLVTVLVVGLAFSLMAGSLDWPEFAGGRFAAFVLIGALVVVAGGAVAARTRHAEGFLGAMARALWGRGNRAAQLALGIGIVACNLAAFAFAARATGTSLSLEAVAVLVPLILAAMLIPASVAGWGFREGAAAALFPIAGATAAAGMAASVAFGAAMLAASLPGAMFIFARSQPIGTPKS